MMVMMVMLVMVYTLLYIIDNIPISLLNEWEHCRDYRDYQPNYQSINIPNLLEELK